MSLLTWIIIILIILILGITGIVRFVLNHSRRVYNYVISKAQRQDDKICKQDKELENIKQELHNVQKANNKKPNRGKKK